MTTQYPGMRLSFNNALCTVRYLGALPGQDGVWLGVEWDDPERGKHDGQYKGKRLFNTLSSSPICASFIRASRVADEPRSFLQALRFKYADDGHERTRLEADGSIEISGKVVEEVGFERIRKQQALLQELKIVLLDGLRIQGVSGETEFEKVQDEIAKTCPSIVELDMSRNLFEHWEDVALICTPLGNLRILKASRLRLATFGSSLSSAFPNVEALHLNDGLLNPDQILDMLCKPTKDGSVESQFPSLTSLSVAGNHLSTFHSTSRASAGRIFPTVKTLSLDTNAFSSLVPLCISLLPLFPNLTTLSLQHNQISTFITPSPTPSEHPPPIYTSITTLNLSHNTITTPEIISSLPQLFPNLTSLRVSNNPFFSSPASSTNHHHHGSEDAAFMLTLARLPTLTMLNYSAVTDKDRMDGELYYLSLAEKEIQSAFGNTGSLESGEAKAVLHDWGRYAELCRKYERENVVEKLAAQASNTRGTAVAGPQKQISRYPPNSLGARLVTITFCFHPGGTTTTKKVDSVALTLPRTLDVYRVKSLLMRKVGREWGLRPLAFVFELFTPPDGDGMEGGHGEEGERELIPDSTRKIGDWIKEGEGECVVWVKPRRETGVEAEKMDLSSLMTMMAV